MKIYHQQSNEKITCGQVFQVTERLRGAQKYLNEFSELPMGVTCQNLTKSGISGREMLFCQLLICIFSQLCDFRKFIGQAGVFRKFALCL